MHEVLQLKEALYLEADALGVAIGAGLLQARNGFRFP